MKVLFYATVAVSGWRVARYFLGRLIARDRDANRSRNRATKASARDIERWETEGGTPA